MAQQIPPAGPCWAMPLHQMNLARVQAAAAGNDQPYQEVVDHFWLNFLIHYLPQAWDCGGERESFTHARGRQQANVVVTNIRQQTHHHVVIVEAKRFPTNTPPGWENDYDWNHVQRIVMDHLQASRRMLGRVQTTYGIVAVGDRCRFFYMPRNCPPRGVLIPWNGNPGNNPVLNAAPILSIHDANDRVTIERLMEEMRQDILSGNNTY
ncbi:hypothetical protein AnigIFM60653_001752 [Aspergillus niger]|nr:hypothetical protein AnigIFM60653_001752 [Aspergillus niger]GLA17534.1 hypothetical protein AnigIFM62618_004674 [Aspergillus niger]GLA41759.1 hypothetical protein AnigIFM63309_009864 [Aspergillus niger]